MKAELTSAQIKIPTTTENVLDLRPDTFVTRDDFQSRLTAKEGEAVSNTETREKLKVEHRDANLKLEMVED